MLIREGEQGILMVKRDRKIAAEGYVHQLMIGGAAECI